MRERGGARDGDIGSAGSDAFEHRRQREQHGRVIGGIGAGVGGARAAAAKKEGSKGSGFGEGSGRRGRGGGGEQAADEFGTAVRDEAKLRGVVLVLGAEDAGAAEQVRIKSESGEQVAGIVGEASSFGEGGRGVRCGVRRDASRGGMKR